jgi:hypothetical protein
MPQTALHSVQSPNAVTAQSIGHSCALQVRMASVAGHALPPDSAARSTLRQRVEVPPLHEFVHSFHALHAPMTQSTGQLCSMHVLVCTSFGQLRPRCAGCTVMERKRVIVPPPHVCEHGLHARYAVTLQSTGHSWMLQRRTVSSSGQASPPLCAAVMIVRFCVW